MSISVVLPTALLALSAPQNVQQRFDTATAAAMEGRCEEAVPAFEALEQTRAFRANALVRAAVSARKGQCLATMDRLDEAEAAIASAMPELERSGPDFVGDVMLARVAAATIAWRRQDYGNAIAHAEKALTNSEGLFRVRPLLMLARLTQFDDDGKAVQYAEKAVALVAADPSTTAKALAAAQTIHARAMLNKGNVAPAYKLLRDSLAKQGGLGTRVSIGDVITRGDLAMAAALAGQRDKAREYLAYTGAGRIADGPLGSAARADPPLCDDRIGLRPDDRAVMEFSIRDDGSVGAVEPIYVSGGRAAALAFAKAVRDWSWKADEAAKIALFHRTAVRVEMRCSLAPPREGVLAPLKEAVTDWLSDQGMTLPEMDMGAPGIMAAMRTRRQQAIDSGNGVALAQASLWLAVNGHNLGAEERATLAEAALTAAATMPVQVRALAEITHEQMLATTKRRKRLEQESIAALLDRPEYAADPLVAATLRMMLVGNAKSQEAVAMVEAVVSDERLGPRHPLKTHALLHRANQAWRKGNAMLAAESLAKTGLSEQQCAVVGLKPTMKRYLGGSENYPMEAVRMGFEGWVSTEFDVQANGRTAAQRVVIAYPPLIFNDAALGMVRDAVFENSYRPETGVACSAESQRISFRLN
jgi:tetratricopeptide (TPR) repeat protein